jgi:hypothetical protein
MTDTQFTEEEKRRGTRSHTGPSNRFVFLQHSRVSEDDHEHSNKNTRPEDGCEALSNFTVFHC